MNSQLKQFISTCQVCQSFQRNNLKESLVSHSIPDRPWSKIAADPFEFKGEHYLVLADYYSDWIEFDKMRDQTATETIALLLKQLSHWGLSDEIVTDCGKNFDSKEFSQFCQRKQIKHMKSSPPHHQTGFLLRFLVTHFFQSKRDQNGGSAAISCHVVASGGRCGRGWPPPTGGVRGASPGKI